MACSNEYKHKNHSTTKQYSLASFFYMYSKWTAKKYKISKKCMAESI